MKFTELKLRGAFIVDIEPREDERGFFARTFCADEFLGQGLESVIAQTSTSVNRRAGTVRGMHYQAAPFQEVKLVRCTSGAVFDVVVDIRPASATFGKWQGVELSRDNGRALYIPKGFAHGFQTLSDDAEIQYQISVRYIASAARGILWNDPDLAIAWPISGGVIVSPRDNALPTLAEIVLLANE